LIPDYCKRKHGEAPVPEVHPIVDQFTQDTYGIMVYQEQVMQIVHHLGGIPLRSAYTLIKAISKKKKNVIDSNRVKFVDGAAEKGLPKEKAEELFELINKFAGYGFNKSHSTGYSIVSYQTAWLKTYFPAQYMAAVLTLEGAAKKIEDLGVYLQDCREVQRPRTRTSDAPHGVSVRSPDVNLSIDGFTVAFDDSEEQVADGGHIRFGLDTIKNVSSAAVRQAVSDRAKNGPFKDALDFCVRVPDINKTGLECLIKAGAFDSLHGFENRSSLVASIEEMLRSAKQDRDDHQAGQASLFGGGDQAASEPTFQLPKILSWSRMEALENEREVLGIWVSGHPLVESKEVFGQLSRGRDLKDLHEMQHDANVALCVVLSQVRPLTIRQGQNAGAKMAMMTLQDLTDKCEGVIFSDGYSKCASALEKAGTLLFVMGRVDRKRSENPQLIVSDALTIDQALSRALHRIDVRLPAGIQSVSEVQDHLRSLHQHQSGEGASLHAFATVDGVEVEIRSSFKLRPSLDLYQQLTDSFGSDSVVAYVEGLEPTEPARFGARRS
jgi:DNA polymerase-3 subunit alpha